MDICRFLNEFMHLSVSKVSQWHSKHASQLWSHHDRRHLARKEPKQFLEKSTKYMRRRRRKKKSLKLWKMYVQLCDMIDNYCVCIFNRQICSLQERPVNLAALSWFITSVLNGSDTYSRIMRWRDSRGHVFLTVRQGQMHVH